MAGIGFELKKLFIGRGAIRKVRAYAYASIVCSGTMLLAVLLLLGIEQLANWAGTPEHEREILISLMVYALLFSLVLSSLLQTLLSRYVADMLYREEPERVMPSLIGGSLVLMAPGGILYALLLSRAGEVPLFDRMINWALFMVLIPVWLQMAYITAAKDYRRILQGFALGVALAFLSGGILLAMGIRALRALMIALFLGYGSMSVDFISVLLRYFPTGKGSALAFVEWFGETPELIWIGFLSMAGAFVHLILMWFSPLGSVITGPFRQAPTHDVAAFFAFLVTLPTNINFVVSVEVNFYQKYRRYFDAITGGGTLREIGIARANMVTSLKQEVFKLIQIQLFCMVVYIVTMRYFLKTIGFTTEMTGMFQVMSIGYSAYAIGNSMMLLQLYFNDRLGALLTSGAFFAVNFAVTAFTMNGAPIYYGVGLCAAGFVMYVVGIVRLFYYVGRIDYHVFCAQPILLQERRGFWARLAARLSERCGRPARPAGETKEIQA